MRNSSLPKEQQSAYQRWEMASLGEDRPGLQQRIRQDASGQQHEQLAALKEQARRQGYEEGRAQGHAEGLSQGRAQAAQECLLLQQIAERFSSEVAKAGELIATDMVQLALEIARAMLKTTLNARPEAIIPLVKEAIGYLPSVQQPALLVLHPLDAALVAEQLGSELNKAGWRLGEDARLERGGCRIDTASNQIDASLPTRWQRIASALGNDLEWLEK